MGGDDKSAVILDGLPFGGVGSRDGGKLLRLDGGASTEIVASGLESFFPAVEMHGVELGEGEVFDEQVHALGLVDKGLAVGGEVDDVLLGDFPDGTIEVFDRVGNALDVLNGAVTEFDKVLHVGVPQTKVGQVLHEVFVDDDEFDSDGLSFKDIGSEWFDGFDIAHNLTGRGGRHERDQQRVAHSKRLDVRA